MNDELPIYEVEELSLEEVVTMLSQEDCVSLQAVPFDIAQINS